MSKRQYNKKSEYWTKKEAVVKAAPKAQNATEESRLVLSPEVGTLGLNSIKNFADLLYRHETKFPESINTYQEMAEDPDIATALDATYTFVDRAFFEFSVSGNVASSKSRKAVKFIDYCLRNMEAPLRQYIRSLLTYKQYGFAAAEKVYMQDEDPRSPYFGMWRLQKLAFRPQNTIDATEPFVFSDDGREILALNQNITSNVLSNALSKSLLGKYTIPMSKLIFVGNDITESNPTGVSPLAAVYRSWREKNLIREYELVGVSKDLGGMPVLLVPSSIMNRAALNPNGEEAASLRILQRNIANLHAGEQQYIVLPSDLYESTSMRQYELVFLGVEGTGKQFDTSALIKQRQQDIYNRFGAASLLSETTETNEDLISLYIERDVAMLCEAINTQLIPQLLRINGMFLSQEDMPVFASGKIVTPDWDVISSAIQRIMGVNAIPKTPGVINEFLALLGMKYRVPDDIANDPEAWQEFISAFMSSGSSRSGDGIAAGSGNGTSTTPATIDTTIANTAN